MYTDRERGAIETPPLRLWLHLFSSPALRASLSFIMLVNSSCPGAAQTSSVLDKLDNESFLMIPLPDTLKTTSQRLPYLVESPDEWYDPACDSMDFLLLQPLTPSVLDHPPSVSCESRMAEHVIDPYNPHEEAFAADRAFYGLQTGQFSKAMGGQGSAQSLPPLLYPC